MHRFTRHKHEGAFFGLCPRVDTCMRSFLLNWAFATCLCCMPLWIFFYIPATDLPQHTAISSIAYRLLQHDPLTLATYTWHIQPIPYYLAYLGLIPSVGFWGPFLGPKIFLHVLAGSFLHALGVCADALHQPRYAMLWGIFLFYNAFFFWGFVTTLVGYVFLLYFLWALTRYLATHTHQYVWMAGVFGCLSTCSHATLVLSCGISCLAWLCQNPRKYFLPASQVALMSLLPMAPWLYQIYATHALEATRSVRFSGGHQLWNHLRLFLGPFDQGLGRNIHQAVFLACLIGLSTQLRRGHFAQNPMRRFWLFVLLGHVALFLATPLAIESPGVSAWLINSRYLVMAEVGLVLCALPSATSKSFRISYLATCVSCCLFFWALCLFWMSFDKKAQEFTPVFNQLEAARCLQVKARPIFFKSAWAPVLSHLYAYHIASHGGYASGIFSSGHMPIAERRARDGAACETDMLLLQNLDSPNDAIDVGFTKPRTHDELWTVLPHKALRP